MTGSQSTSKTPSQTNVRVADDLSNAVRHSERDPIRVTGGFGNAGTHTKPFAGADWIWYAHSSDQRVVNGYAHAQHVGYLEQHRHGVAKSKRQPSSHALAEP